jgi:hypothetical protein
LYSLLRRIEAGAEAGQLRIRKSAGVPWELDENGGHFALNSESDIEDEFGHDEDEGEAEIVGTQLPSLNVNG